MDEEALQEFSEMVSDLKSLNAEICALNNAREKHLEKCSKRIHFLLKHRLNEWKPQIGESLVRVSLERGIAYELIIREVKGRMLRAQEGEKSCYHRIDLEFPVEECEVADFLVPVDLYHALKPQLDVVFLPTLLGNDAKIPDWA